LYIHGHSAGGTNPSLVEAMCLGLPVLAFDCIYNRATTEEGCMYWKDAKELQLLLTNPLEKYKDIGTLMLEKGQALYTWEKIALQYHTLY
jgi:glycosyltransferase involved in cell wall biosynthesis